LFVFKSLFIPARGLSQIEASLAGPPFGPRLQMCRYGLADMSHNKKHVQDILQQNAVAEETTNISNSELNRNLSFEHTPCLMRLPNALAKFAKFLKLITF
jgi:hypothetical protein